MNSGLKSEKSIETKVVNPQAEELNSILKKDGAAAYSLLSGRGRNIFFPRKGLVAQGQDAKGKSINVSIGEAREDDGSPLCLSPLSRRIELPSTDAFPYASSFGKLELRNKWAELLREKNPSLGSTPFSLPVVTNALTHGLSTAGYLFIDEGDEIILPEHYWGNYKLVFNQAFGAEFCTYPTFSGEGPNAGFNVAGFEQALCGGKGSFEGMSGAGGPAGISPDTDRPAAKKIVLFNFPNNPTGYTPTETEVKEICAILKKSADEGNKILVILDDAYFGLVYREGVEKESLFAKLASLHKNLLVCKVDGATKEDYAWGFRVGFVTYAGLGMGRKALDALVDKTAGAVRGSISNDSHLAQSLLLSLYNSPDYASEKKRAYKLLKSRFDAVAAELENHPEYKERFEPLPYNSGYFMCVKLAGGNAEQVRQILLEKYDMGVIALGDLIRIAYSCMPVNLAPKVFANLYSACGDVLEA